MAKCPFCGKVLHLKNMLYAPRSQKDKPDPIESVLLDKSVAHMWACPECDRIVAITEIPRKTSGE